MINTLPADPDTRATLALTMGFSPCPNDTFMFDALVHHRIDWHGIIWRFEIEDVETLNRRAMGSAIDVTKLSIYTWLKIAEHYALLRSGAALGHGCGPLLVSTGPLSEKEILSGPIAIPGELTTAHLLFRLRYPEADNTIPMLFSRIEDALISGKVVAGVIIHENRFTYAQKGLIKILDLGEYWEAETGCPVPLGGIAIRKSLGPETAAVVEEQIRASIGYAYAHPHTWRPFVRSHAREMDEYVMQQHIDTYVNHYSLDLGEAGSNAIQTMQKRAVDAGLL